jgi:poly-beta-1,6-N-acetyl-D-glucosamine synthase
MSVAAELLFWSSIALIGYIFVGYPIALTVIGAMKPRPWRRDAGFHPRVSVVIAAHNESALLLSKIENLLSLDYPEDRLEILVGSDGSTDDTAAQLQTITDARVRTFLFSKRCGKPSVLNALIPKATGEIVVLADVRQRFDRQVLRALTQSFADEQIGAVTGELILGSVRDKEGEGAGLYWRFEKLIRAQECRIDSTMVVTGAIYAIRQHLFEPIACDTICDDLVIPLSIARRGYRVVFEREARAYDALPPTGQEFTRKVRTLAGAFQFFARHHWVFNPRRNRLWWQTMSHKLLRLCIAPLQLIALGANIVLAPASALYSAILVAQALFYAGAMVAVVLPHGWKRPRAVAFPFIFCVLSWATVVGFFRWITRRQQVTWQKAAA